MTNNPHTPADAAAMRELLSRAKKVRSQLCIDCECTFDKGCGCLEAIMAALPTSAREIDREKIARIISGGRAFYETPLQIADSILSLLTNTTGGRE